MRNLNEALAEVWEETQVDTVDADFNSLVFEKVARRRAIRELGVAALIATAVWAIAWALGPVLASVWQPLNLVATASPVLLGTGLVAGGLGLWLVLQQKLVPGLSTLQIGGGGR